MGSSHEEADSKIILHAIDATKRGATQLDIHSPDTDVLVLALSKCRYLPKDTNFITGSGRRRRSIPLIPVFSRLGRLKAEGLISGADVTGTFHKKGTLSFWKPFVTADDNLLQALQNLGKTSQMSEDTMLSIEAFICKVYMPSTKITTVGELRWWFRKSR